MENSILKISKRIAYVIYGWTLIVNMRRAQLGYLRTQDYRHFEWLLEKLNIVYKPRPMIYERVIRRRHTERWVNFLLPQGFVLVQIVLGLPKLFWIGQKMSFHLYEDKIFPINCFRLMHSKTF